MTIGQTAGVQPVAVGGVGGSGTRLIAEILRQLDYYIGDDLNVASDNLWFTLLFRRVELLDGDPAHDDFMRGLAVFQSVMQPETPLSKVDEDWVRTLALVDRPQHPVAWLQKRVDSLLLAARANPSQPGPWGWKAPITHVFLDRLSAALPAMRYIHVMRNGLDMAYSANQGQLSLLGRYFLGTDDYQVCPRYSLKFWCSVHRRVATVGAQMPGRCLVLNYDDFCAAPREGLGRLLQFLGLKVSAAAESSVIALVRPPTSIGRFAQHSLANFDAEDVEYVRSLGYAVSAQQTG